MPRSRSLESKRALPPVSPARAKRVSCDCWKLLVFVWAAVPEYMPELPGEPWVASPSGAWATRPRASMGQKETPARMAASTVACSCAWFNAVEAQSAGEVDERFLLLQ